MLDDNDIKKLKDVFATKNEIQEMFTENNKKLREDFATKNEIQGMFVENNKKLIEEFSNIFPTKTDFEDFKEEYRAEFAKVLGPVDKKVGAEADAEQENVMLKGKIDRHEKWINQIATKVDLQLES